MTTDKRLIHKALIILDGEEISLEEAVSKASKEINLSLADDIRIIRDFLRNENLLRHNPRLTYLNQKQFIQGTNIAFVTDIVDDSFINDHLTEKCIDLINKGLLHDYLLKTMM